MVVNQINFSKIKTRFKSIKESWSEKQLRAEVALRHSRKGHFLIGAMALGFISMLPMELLAWGESDESGSALSQATGKDAFDKVSNFIIGIVSGTGGKLIMTLSLVFAATFSVLNFSAKWILSSVGVGAFCYFFEDIIKYIFPN